MVAVRGARLCIGTCTLHHPDIHGISQDSTPGVEAHFIVDDVLPAHGRLDPIPEARPTPRRAHPSVRAYTAVSAAVEDSAQLMELLRLPGGEDVAIIKTVWIRLLQRHIRSWVRARQQSEP